MWFVSLLSSDAAIENHPQQVLVAGSNDFDGKAGAWTILYDSSQHSNSIFSGPSEEKSLVFSNDKNYKHYSMIFVRQENSSKIQVGNYGVIQAYTKMCSSELFHKLTGVAVPAQLTSAPTNAPTKEPTSFPTSPAPTNLALNDDSIRQALEWWWWGGENIDRVIAKWGHIKDWNTSEVTDMSQFFYHKGGFNEDISGWDTSSVTNMIEMFYMCSMNVDISGWDTSKVTNMRRMFHGAANFDRNLSSWDVSKVQTMYSMFGNTPKLNQQLCWDVTGKDNRIMFNWSKGCIISSCCPNCPEEITC